VESCGASNRGSHDQNSGHSLLLAQELVEKYLTDKKGKGMDVTEGLRQVRFKNTAG
jgi:hypothetical protein